jgi:hypothetical protein|tara:strand:- start:486 stop:674 length:189 start_codon:yes stop_codon:yes gene_type:complete
MNSQEFYLWLNGYLEALESEGVEKCNIKNIRDKMKEVKARSQERVVFGPNVTQPGYAQQPHK